MKLTKFRIQNYKSIIDSGYCTLASDMTILVGKNESGKTATLEALNYLNKDFTKAPADAYPVDGNFNDPQVEANFTLERAEIEQIQEESGVKLTDDTLAKIMNHGLTVIKDSEGRYHLSAEGMKEVVLDQSSGNQPLDYIRTAKNRVQELMDATFFPNIDYDSSPNNIQKQSKSFIKVVKSKLPSIKDESTQVEVVEAIRTIVKESSRLTEPQAEQAPIGTPAEQDLGALAVFMEQFVERMPHFIYFAEFSGVLPFEVPIDKLKENQAVLDFAKISGLDLDYFIQTEDVQRRINFLNRHATQISGHFHDYWDQDKIELVVKSEGDNLVFGIKEEGKPDFFKVEQRSKGFRWFLSFYLRIKAQQATNNVILIDEPGVNLHANAQKEILKVLERDIAKEAQVLFSTHCPYLINPQRLDRVRILVKSREAGSVISDDVHGLSDDESLAPVMTATGGEQSGFAPMMGQKNVIVGSVHDFYFWKAMRSYFPDIKGIGDLNLLPAADTNSAEQLIAMLIGYDEEFQVLLNHNNEGWKFGQSLKDKFGFEDERITFVSDKLGYFTEDLFSFNDFKSLVLDGENIEEQATLNSTYLRNNNINKIFIARRLYEKVKSTKELPPFSEETITAFRETFAKLLANFAGGTTDDTDERIVNDELNPNKTTAKGGVKRKSLFAFLRNK